MRARLMLCVMLTGGGGWTSCYVDRPVSAPPPPAAVREVSLPPPGTEPLETLSAHEVHELRLQLDPGQAISLDVVQRGVDLILEVTQPDGPDLEIDTPIEDQGPEHVCLATTTGGSFQVRIRSLDATEQGLYSIHSTGVRQSGPRDYRCLDATARYSQLEHSKTPPPIEQAAAEYARLAKTFVEIGHPFQAASVNLSLAWAWEREGRLPPQLAAYQAALELTRTLADLPGEASILLQMGLVFRDLGEPEQAQGCFQRALQLAEELGSLRTKAIALNNLALLKRQLGHWHEALDGYLQTLRLLRDLGEERRVASALNNIGFCLTAVGRYREGLDRLAEARQVLQRLEAEGSSGSTNRTLSNVWQNIGRIYYFQEKYDLAVEAFERALEVGPSSVDRPKALLRLAGGYRAAKRFPDALETYQEAIELAHKHGSLPQATSAEVGLASLHRESGRPAESIRQLRQTQATLARLNDPEVLATAYGTWALAERDLGHPVRAQQMFERCFEEIRRLRSTAWAQGEQLRPVSSWQSLLESYVALLMQMHRQTPDQGLDRLAFEVADAERGRLFYESLLASLIDPHEGASSELLSRERDLRDQLKARSERRSVLVSAGQDPDELAAVEVDLRNLTLQYERLQAEILRSNLRFAELRDPRPLGLAEVQSALDEDTLLLRYFLGHEASYVFFVEHSGFSSRELPPAAQIASLAQEVYRGWSSPQRRAMSSTLRRAQELSQTLLMDVEAYAPEKKRLVVVADGMLHYLPFAALPLPPRGESGGIGGAGELLVDRFELTHLPLAAALPNLRRRESSRQRPPHLLAVIADPVFSAQDPRVSPPAALPRETGPNPAAPDASDEIPRLVGSRREAESIFQQAADPGALLALDFAANTSLFTQQLARYRILHIATHAVIEEAYPELYRILLSRVTETGQIVDGSFSLHELYSIELPADLVVLSGCQTALGEQVRGEGLMGWTRGFFNAGASRLLVSLWDIDDRATADFMAEFYRGLLGRGLSPAAALRQAQNQLRHSPRWSHPYYWSGFILQGDWRPFSF